MSGTDEYINGTEAEIFFNSIQLKQQETITGNFISKEAGFHVHFPQSPQINSNTFSVDNINRWEFEANDSINGNAYLVYKKTVTNLNFIEEDTFDLSLVEQSLKSSGIIKKETARSFLKFGNYNALKMQFITKDERYINAEAILKGPQYFLLTQTSSKKNGVDTSFFNSFSFEDFSYPSSTVYTDTLLDFVVKTPVQPTLDSSLTHIMYEVLHDENLVAQMQAESYWPKNKYAMFKSDSTGESILLSMYEYPKYYFSKDSATFWKKQLNFDNADENLYSATAYIPCDDCEGYKIVLRDTNTVRQIINYKILKNNRLYNLYTITDTSNLQSSFIKDFFETFKPLNKQGSSVYTDKTKEFFKDLYSKDSSIKSKARNAIANINYGAENIDRVVSFINNLKYNEQDYFEMKQKFIAELGYIDDSCCTNKVVAALDSIYKKTADTAYFQNEVFEALANLRTKESYQTLKTLLLQDPPLFNNYDEYDDFFEKFRDSLQLTCLLFPEILQLATIEDYKEPVIDLLSTLLDSNYISAKDYKDYFSKIYFDAKIEMKKQQNAEEKLLEQQTRESFNEDEPESNNYISNNYTATDVDKYAELLLPFYDSVAALPKFFDKLLQSRDTALQLSTAILLIQNHKKVADSIINNIALKDNYRSDLYSDLEDINNEDLFPSTYKKQELIARSLLMSGSKKDLAAIEFAGKVPVNLKNKKGYVYFFRYKNKKDDGWQIGISGPQPFNAKEINTDDALTALTGEKLTTDKTESEQFNEQLLKLILNQHKSARHFFEADESAYDYNDN